MANEPAMQSVVVLSMYVPSMIQREKNASATKGSEEKHQNMSD